MSEAVFTARVGRRFQITIPKNVREMLEIHIGDYVEVKVKRRGLR